MIKYFAYSPANIVGCATNPKFEKCTKSLILGLNQLHYAQKEVHEVMHRKCDKNGFSYHTTKTIGDTIMPKNCICIHLIILLYYM